jgi:hypothetical protein
MQFDYIALPGERIQIVRNSHQIGFRRKFVSRMPSIAIGKDAQLAGIDKAL